MYRSLDPDRTIETIDKLQRRIFERFPGSGLLDVCNELACIARETKPRVEAISRPNYPLRAGILLLITIAFAALVYSIALLDLSLGDFNVASLVQVTEAAINEIVLMGAAIFFLVTVETRIKRAAALLGLHELRSIIHVIDMHQLTKDPSRGDDNLLLTPSSPQTQLSPYELTRYLNYCSELLSLTGKVSALYAQNLRDSVVLSAVSEIENLTTGLSRKAWQKISILYARQAARSMQIPSME